MLTPPPVPDRLQVPEGNEAVSHRPRLRHPGLRVRSIGFWRRLCVDDARGRVVRQPGTAHRQSLLQSQPRRGRHDTRHVAEHTGLERLLGQGGSHAATFLTDPDFVAPDAIAWVLLSRAGVLEGVGGGNTLAVATFVQRVNTVGGLAPSIGCNSPADIGNTAFVPYEADYVFFTNPTATTAVSERN